MDVTDCYAVSFRGLVPRQSQEQSNSGGASWERDKCLLCWVGPGECGQACKHTRNGYCCGKCDRLEHESGWAERGRAGMAIRLRGLDVGVRLVCAGAGRVGCRAIAANVCHDWDPGGERDARVFI